MRPDYGQRIVRIVAIWKAKQTDVEANELLQAAPRSLDFLTQ
jgi:hypothetical protein